MILDGVRDVADKKQSEAGKSEAPARDSGAAADEGGREERTRKGTKATPPPAREVGDETPNPLPDDQSDMKDDGDPGRTA